MIRAREQQMQQPFRAFVGFAADKKIPNLNGSRKINRLSLIDSHGDVTGPAITWAFASLVASL